MKKLLLILVFIICALALNAQTTANSQARTAPTSSTAQQEERIDVSEANLPKAITVNFAKDYIGYKIKDAARVTRRNVVTYEVNIVKGTAIETIVYDKDGKFVTRIVQKK